MLKVLRDEEQCLKRQLELVQAKRKVLNVCMYLTSSLDVRWTIKRAYEIPEPFIFNHFYGRGGPIRWSLKVGNEFVLVHYETGYVEIDIIGVVKFSYSEGEFFMSKGFTIVEMQQCFELFKRHQHLIERLYRDRHVISNKCEPTNVDYWVMKHNYYLVMGNTQLPPELRKLIWEKCLRG